MKISSIDHSFIVVSLSIWAWSYYVSSKVMKKYCRFQVV